MNALSKEVEEWWKNASPQSNSDGHFHTEAPIIIFKMVDENLQLAESVGYAFSKFKFPRFNVAFI